MRPTVRVARTGFPPTPSNKITHGTKAIATLPLYWNPLGANLASPPALLRLLLPPLLMDSKPGAAIATPPGALYDIPSSLVTPFSVPQLHPFYSNKRDTKQRRRTPSMITSFFH